MDVGVRELKQHLSEYVRRAASGETVRVTDRGVPVAVLAPIAATDPLGAAIDDGLVRPALANRRVGGGVRAKAARRVADALNEDRGE